VAIGILKIDLYFPGVKSLKNKRQILKSLKDRIGNKFNVSVAEMDAHDKWQRGILGVVTINISKGHIEGLLNSVIQFIEANHYCQILDHQIEFF